MISKNQRTELVQYAENNMWSFPIINLQYQLELQKISGSMGFTDTFRYMGKWRSVPLKLKYFHVFSLSGVNTGYWNFHSIINNKDPVDRWLNLADLCRVRGINLNLYDDSGKIYPRDKAWVMRGYDGLNLIALEFDPGYQIKELQPFYVQCYTVKADIYRGDQPEFDTRKFRFFSSTPRNEEEARELYSTYNQWLKEPGVTLIYRNGVLVNDLPKIPELSEMDTWEIAHDPSVVEITQYRLKDCADFYSDMDEKRKYIIHPPKPQIEDWKYRYFSDTDIYLLNGKGSGVLLNRNDAANIRQLTHRDYAISDDIVVRTVNRNPEIFSKGEDLSFLIFRRHNDITHELQHEANYIRYLYRMDDQRIMTAFTDVHSTMLEWSASGLEASMTMNLNRRVYTDINNEAVVQALGYNVCGTILSQSPIQEKNEFEEIDVPFTYRDKSVVFEYDKDGIYLGHQQISNTARYSTTRPEAELFEFVPGVKSSKIHYIMQDEPIPLLKKWGYSVYICGRIMPGNKPDEKWTLAVPDKDYEVKDGTLHWLYNPSLTMGLVTFNDQFILREFKLKHLDNTLSFSITHEWEGGGIGLPLAPANITVIMNNRTLIENVDYIVRYPDVYIINKEFIKDGGEQDFVVYYHGWSPKVTEPLNRSELGFVSGGVIGLNNRYNIRDNRVTKTTVYGRVFDTRKLNKAEHQQANELLNGLNGYPYQVKHQYTAVQGMRDYDNYYLYLKSVNMDSRASDYLTEHCDKPEASVIATQNDKYSVYSPFMSKIINDINLGLLDIKSVGKGEVYDTQYLTDKTIKYQWMLDFDPAHLRFDDRYFIIQPVSTNEPFKVTPEQFLFIKAVNDFYLEGRCQVEGYLEVKHV